MSTSEVIKTPSKKEKESSTLILGMIYSCIVALIGWSAEFTIDRQLMNLQILISKCYYIFSTIDHLRRFEYICYEESESKRLALLKHKILFLLHHIITLWLLFYSHLYIDPDVYLVCLNRMFAIFITSNILLYYVTLKCKTNWHTSLMKVIVITLETIKYIVFRLILPWLYIAEHINLMDTSLVVAIMVLYIAGIWWSYGMCKKLIVAYIEYYNSFSKKQQ